MGRAWRIECEGALYHVMSRGNQGNDIFLDDSDRQVFLLEHIIKIGSNESSLVFDPFMGVGSTGVAAIKLKRKFLGIEIEQS
jgi:adenine specific DNA methylase Mod